MISKPKVLLIVTGGTIASVPHPRGGLRPISGLLSKELSNYPEFKHELLPNYDILEQEEAIDSSLFNPAHQIQLATQISENYHDYSGFVVVHGTDTMAYTASALSFMLDGLAKPVVFTGAQIPLGELFNDAKRNLISAILVAAGMDVPEVSICFANRLTRANRTTKLDSQAQDAYESPNYPILAQFGIDVSLKHENILSPPKRRFKAYTNLFTNIVVLWLIPGFDDEILESFLDSSDKKDKALVLACYGSGNAPVNKSTFRSILEKLFEKKIVVVITSQCIKGAINLNLYQTGIELQKMGFISAKDMTTEACVTKLAYLMGRGLRGESLKIAMETSLRGELSTYENSQNIHLTQNNQSYNQLSELSRL